MRSPSSNGPPLPHQHRFLTSCSRRTLVHPQEALELQQALRHATDDLNRQVATTEYERGRCLLAATTHGKLGQALRDERALRVTALLRQRVLLAALATATSAPAHDASGAPCSAGHPEGVLLDTGLIGMLRAEEEAAVDARIEEVAQQLASARAQLERHTARADACEAGAAAN